MDIQGYFEIDRYDDGADLLVHLLYHGEDIGGAMKINYCPICGSEVLKCSCLKREQK